jgi:hypothetical protein
MGLDKGIYHDSLPEEYMDPFYYSVVSLGLLEDLVFEKLDF